MALDELKKRLLNFASQFSCVALYDSNSISLENSKLDWIFACGNDFSQSFQPDLNRLQLYLNKNTDEHVFGLISYDLKQEIEGVSSNNPAFHNVPFWTFFTPEVLVKSVSGQIYWLKGNEGLLPEMTEFSKELEVYTFSPQISKTDYLKALSSIQQNLQKGNIYELNFCREFHCIAENEIPVYSLYQSLQAANPSSFSAFFRVDDKVLISSSPERYIMKSGNTLISEPIKGTIARSPNQEVDESNAIKLKNSEKERRENVMIVDLVRNDLSRIAKPNTVRVESLYSIRSLPKVHQMVSVISAELESNIEFTEILRSSFPMGSMTGAPKIAAMKLAEELESFRRGWYSGSVGYIEPNGDFDFNVIIRSLIVERDKNRMSTAAGGAITILSDPEMEFQESEWKVQSVLKSIGAIVASTTADGTEVF